MGRRFFQGARRRCSFTRCWGTGSKGQRQRGDEEGQTFTKDIGKEVLPTFLSVADDPTRDEIRQHVAERQLRI